MTPDSTLTLRQRLNSLLLRWAAFVLLGGAAILHFTVGRLRDDLLAERLRYASSLAATVDAEVRAESQQLARAADGLAATAPGDANRLRQIRFEGRLREGAFLLDSHGAVVLADPPGAQPPAVILDEKQPVTPLLRREGRSTIAFVAPVATPLLGAERGAELRWLVVEANPLSIDWLGSLSARVEHAGMVIGLIDRRGYLLGRSPKGSARGATEPVAVSLAGTEARSGGEIIADGPCALCPSGAGEGGSGGDAGGTVLAVVPLRSAPWALVLEEPRSHAFASVHRAGYAFLGLAGVVFATGALLARGLGRSLVEPLRLLAEQADGLRRLDLEQEISARGDREVNVLAGALDEARRRLSGTMSELRNLNETLEDQVRQRTEALAERIGSLRLLHDVAQICQRERAAAEFLPRVLRRLSEHFSFHSVAIDVDVDGRREVHTFPPLAALGWLGAGASGAVAGGDEVPPGWRSVTIRYSGDDLGHLWYRWEGIVDERVLAALVDQLALSIHDAGLLRRTLEQDAERRTLVRRLLAAGEEERRRIARELHDEISQLLTVIHLSLGRLASDPSELGKASSALERAQKELHRIIYDLRPSLLDDLGLGAAVRWYAENYLRPHDVEVSLAIEPRLELPDEIEIVVFRIYQEIVTNVLRHASADHVAVELSVNGGRLVLDVEDDGRGFGETTAEGRAAGAGGAGLIGMRERAELVGGNLTIDSEPGLGTHVRLEVPLLS